MKEVKMVKKGKKGEKVKEVKKGESVLLLLPSFFTLFYLLSPFSPTKFSDPRSIAKDFLFENN
jgi:hypothetical protein